VKCTSLSSSGLTEELCGENFLGHLKKNIVQRNVAGKKILASNWGMKKNSCKQLGDEKKFVHRKIAQPPPPPQISNVRPLLNIGGGYYILLIVDIKIMRREMINSIKNVCKRPLCRKLLYSVRINQLCR
jgi:hypothetical protein